jgi:hypothetical protein
MSLSWFLYNTTIIFCYEVSGELSGDVVDDEVSTDVSDEIDFPIIAQFFLAMWSPVRSPSRIVCLF